MAGDRDVKLTLRVSAEGLEIVDQVGKKLGVVQAETAKTTTSLAGMKSAVPALNSVATSIGLVTTAAGLASAALLSIGRAINELDAINTLSLKTGQSAETLSRLAYSAELADVSMGELGVSLKFFGRNLDEARRGNVDAIATFGRLGVDFKQGLAPALIEAADRFNRLESAEARTALATELFGRSGEALLPLFAEGTAGLRAQAEEAERLGVVMSTSAARAADQFNDNLTKLSAVTRGLAIDTAEQLLPTLVDVSGALVSLGIEAGETGGIFDDFADGFLANNSNMLGGVTALLAKWIEFRAAVDKDEARFKAVTSGASSIVQDSASLDASSDLGQTTLEGGALSAFSDQQAFNSPAQREAFARDKSLAEQARILEEAEKRRVEEAKRAAGELSRLDRTRRQEQEAAFRDELAATRTLGEASIARAETEVDIAKQRAAYLDEETATDQQRLTLAQQIDAAERAALDAKVAAIEEEKRAILDTAEPTREQLAQVEALTAEVERMKAVWAATPSEVAKTTREIEKSSKIDLGGSIKDVITGTALGTGNIGDSLKRLGETVGSQLFTGILDEKVGFDLEISKNFLDDVPGWIESGASMAQDAWSGALDAMGLSADQASTKITDSFSSAFSDISSQAGDAAQNIGGQLRNVPGVGNVAELFNGGANVQITNAGGGRFRAVNELDQKFTGPDAGQLAGVAGGGGTNAAGFAATAGAAAATFGIALGVQAGLEGISEVRRLSKSDNPKDLEYARYAMLDPVQAGLSKMLGVHDLTLLRGFNAMFSMGISEVAAKMFEAMGVFAAPHAEGVLGNQLGQVFDELGIPTARAAGGRRPGGPSTRPFDPAQVGDLGFPQIPIPDSVRNDLRSSGLLGALAQFSQIRFGGLNGVGLQGEIDAAESPILGILNNAAALGLGREDTRRQVGRITRGLAGETFDEGVLTLRKESQDRLFGVASRNGGVVSDLTRGKEQESLERGIAGLIEAFDEDLPRAVDASRLALLAFGEGGELQLEALNRQIKTAKDLASGLDLGGAARAGFDTTSKLSFGQQLTANARGSAVDALLGGLSEGGIGDPFKAFTASIAEGTEALRNGDLDRANDIIERAGREFDIARDSADDYFATVKREVPAMAALIDRVQFDAFGEQFKDSAKSLREEADDLGLSLLKPKQREAEIRNRLGANQSEIDAILNSSGGADTADELTRLGELGAKRRDLLGDLGSILDERFVDGSQREVAAMREVQGGLLDLATILEGAGITAETQAASLADQAVVVQANTDASEANTAATHELAEAIRALAATADNAGGGLEGGAIAFLTRVVATNPALKAALREVVA